MDMTKPGGIERLESSGENLRLRWKVTSIAPVASTLLTTLPM